MKHNSNIRLFKIALLIGVLGLSILLGIIVSGAAVRNLYFALVLQSGCYSALWGQS